MAHDSHPPRYARRPPSIPVAFCLPLPLSSPFLRPYPLPSFPLHHFTAAPFRSMPATCTMHPPRPDFAAVEARTMAWARVVVCGLNLCPFAQPVLDARTVRVQVHPACDEAGVKEGLVDEIGRLLRTPCDKLSTTLLVLPRFAPKDFLRFHTLCVELEDRIEGDEGLVDEVMLACFHPRHEWGGGGGEPRAVNFDKRAPYPVINLLRAGEVDRYAREGKTQGILKRNEETLERLGVERLRELYRSLAGVQGEG